MDCEPNSNPEIKYTKVTTSMYINFITCFWLTLSAENHKFEK